MRQSDLSRPSKRTMTGRAVLLVLLFACVASAAAVRQPFCPLPGSGPLICPMIWTPRCGDDGNTYSNDCEMCSKIEQYGKNIQVVKEDIC